MGYYIWNENKGERQRPKEGLSAAKGVFGFFSVVVVVVVVVP